MQRALAKTTNAVFFGLILVSAVSRATVASVRTVVLSGDQAPGNVSGDIFGYDAPIPLLSNSGRVAFLAEVDVPNSVEHIRRG